MGNLGDINYTSFTTLNCLLYGRKKSSKSRQKFP